MNHKITISAITIMVLCLFWGLFSEAGHFFLYETFNGPPLVTDGFSKRLKEAQEKNPHLDEKLMMGVHNNGAFWITSNRLRPNLSIAIHAVKIHPHEYCIITSVLPVPIDRRLNQEEKEFFEYCRFSHHKLVSDIELNELIDKYHFPFKSVRTVEKLGLLAKLEPVK